MMIEAILKMVKALGVMGTLGIVFQAIAGILLVGPDLFDLSKEVERLSKGDAHTAGGIVAAVIATILMVGRIVSSGEFANASPITFQEFVDRLPVILSKDSDLLIFKNSAKGREHCIRAIKTAILVKNTELRFGSSKAAAEGDREYQRWRDAKRDVILSMRCNFQEIISSHFEATDPDIQLMRDGNAQGSIYYEGKIIDEIKVPVVQLILFVLEDGSKEVIFGWEFHGLKQGPCFHTKNAATVEYFERYFDFVFEKIAEKP